MTTTPSPIEQFIAKLEELERTMTGGKWGYQGLHSNPPLLSWLKTNDGAGCAHLKNSNPTVIEMLKAAIEGLKRVVNGDHSGTRSRESHHAVQTLAHLNTLAASALGTTGEK